jgi:hypothetical protein
MTLELANDYGLTFGDFANANFLAQGFGRTNPSAHASQNVLRQDRARRSFRSACSDLSDKQRYVD